MNPNMNRCIAINKNNKKCRAKTKNNDLFCCSAHYPINTELVTEGCFICNEKIINSNELIYFNCKHAFHRPCYNEWLQYSTYANPICLLCRKDIIINKDNIDKKKLKKLNKIFDIYPLIQISSELNKIVYYNHIENIINKNIFF